MNRLILTITNNNKRNKMNNLKKIGLTALAGSLVATSVAYAGALTATGSAESVLIGSTPATTAATGSTPSAASWASN